MLEIIYRITSLPTNIYDRGYFVGNAMVVWNRMFFKGNVVGSSFVFLFV